MTCRVQTKIIFTASFKDHLVGQETVADYLLYWFNKNEEFGYVSALELDAPTDNVMELLLKISIRHNLRKKIRHVEGNFSITF